MKINLSRGCYSENLTVDGDDFKDCDQQRLRAKLLEFLKEHDLFDLTKLILDSYGSVESDAEPCEQCGNWGSETTLEI